MKEEQGLVKRAIAIRYEEGKDDVPIITAVGRGATAEKIMKRAEENDVPVVEDDFQVNALANFEAGSKIPKFLYDLIAEVLLFVEEIDERKQERGGLSI